jgi:hypothetical protein
MRWAELPLAAQARSRREQKTKNAIRTAGAISCSSSPPTAAVRSARLDCTASWDSTLYSYKRNVLVLLDEPAARDS